MDQGRQDVFNELDFEQYDQLFKEYDGLLSLNDFMRKYTKMNIKQYSYSPQDLENAYIALNKKDQKDRHFDCRACGSETCKEMATKVAMGIDLPENCIKKLRDEVLIDHHYIVDIATRNIESLNHVIHDFSDIKNKSYEIQNSLETLNNAIKQFESITSDINTISTQVNLIALNASITASRAGEQGKTFAVVADEIRNLANKSKQTVSESQNIVTESTKSISAINEKTNNIRTDIDDAHDSISNIHLSLNQTIEKTKKWEDV